MGRGCEILRCGFFSYLLSFFYLQRICLRQNAITEIDGLSCLGASLQELDLYDNLISRIERLDDLARLTSLDLSFNKIKHIRNIGHLKQLKDVFFVQNKISKIEGLDGLDKLSNLELGANRIRVREDLPPFFLLPTGDGG